MAFDVRVLYSNRLAGRGSPHPDRCQHSIRQILPDVKSVTDLHICTAYAMLKMGILAGVQYANLYTNETELTMFFIVSIGDGATALLDNVQHFYAMRYAEGL